ncbi:MAG TPA: AraC family transcriptional regulator, partial [Polyangiaceae bacterium]|nr:AraC family transcriptional regulator [Polyangiaceae bacterium]
LQSRTGALDVRDAPDSRAEVKRLRACPPRSSLLDGGSGPRTAFVAVGLHLSPHSSGALLAQLPPMLVTSPDASATLAPAASLFRTEATAGGHGRRALLGRLTEIIFIDMLRREGERACSARGDLKAFADPALAKALAALHAKPGHDWTIELLGRAAGLSRSAFAARFLAKVGEPPLHYVTRFRMTRAADLLLETDAGLGNIAAQVGYRSEAAFSRAFTRFLGVSPGAFRTRERHRHD